MCACFTLSHGESTSAPVRVFVSSQFLSLSLSLSYFYLLDFAPVPAQLEPIHIPQTHHPGSDHGFCLRQFGCNHSNDTQVCALHWPRPREYPQICTFRLVKNSKFSVMLFSHVTALFLFNHRSFLLVQQVCGATLIYISESSAVQLIINSFLTLTLQLFSQQ